MPMIIRNRSFNCTSKYRLEDQEFANVTHPATRDQVSIYFAMVEEYTAHHQKGFTFYSTLYCLPRRSERQSCESVCFAEIERS